MRPLLFRRFLRQTTASCRHRQARQLRLEILEDRTLLAVASVPILFDAVTRQLVIHPAPGEHTIRETLTADGFVEVVVDDQLYSSKPTSAWFNRALAGLTAASLAGIRID